MGTSLLLVWTQPDDLCPEFAKTEVDLPGAALSNPLVRLFSIQLAAAKVSKPDFGPNQRKFRRHFKGLFWNGNMEVRILPGQPTSPAPRDFTLRNARKARQWRAFAIQRTVSKRRIWPLPARNSR